MSKYIYIAYSDVFPYLPIAVGDTARELAEYVGAAPQTIRAYLHKCRHGLIKSDHPKYARVSNVDED